MKKIVVFFILIVTTSTVFSNCIVVDVQYSHPATDFTGKTVFTKKTTIKECTDSSEKQIGCNAWNIITTNGSLDYNVTKVGTVFKQGNGSDEASQLMAMLENQFHLFSGWEGYCDSGTLFENPFSDPMALLGYATMVYGAASKGELGTTAQSATDSVKVAADAASDAFTAATDSVTEAFDNVKAALADPDLISEDALLDNVDSLNISGAAAETSQSFIDSVKDMNTIPGADISFGSIGDYKLVMKFYYTDILQLGMSLMPTEEEMQSANDFNMAWLGNETNNQNSVAYANCMASIGLSYPNLISSFAGFTDDTSEELAKVYENPLSLTYAQLAHLVSSTDFVGITDVSELPPEADANTILQGGFVDSMYGVLSNDPDAQKVVLIAKTPLAYTTAGQAICSGKLAKAQNILTPPPDENSNSGIAEAVGMMAVKKVLGMLPFPYNFIASIIVDVLTSISSVDACHDAEDAMKMGILQLKTNKFLNFNQCYPTKTTCQDKFLGSCILHRHHHCCYDQISTRIFAEGIKEELGLPMEECNNIKLDDLKEISFVKCAINTDPNLDIDEDGEMDEYVSAFDNHCFPGKKWDEFKEAIEASGVANFDFEGAASQAINSLAIPNSVCEINATNNGGQ